MSEIHENPKEFSIEDRGFQIKFKYSQLLEAVLRTAIDVHKGSLGGGTFPAWAKAISEDRPKEKQAYHLIANALMGAVRQQIKESFSSRALDTVKDLVTKGQELNYDIFDGLQANGYTFSCQHIDHPRSFDLLRDFVGYYEDWLTDTALPLESAQARQMAAKFPNHFAIHFYKLLEKDKEQYADLLQWCNSPTVTKWAAQQKQLKYEADLLSKYHAAALGEKDIPLSKVYVEPRFRVYQRAMSSEKLKEVEEGRFHRAKKPFVPITDCGSIHDYLRGYFFKTSSSPTIQHELERSRMLLLLGHPGHGKSSFCYRSIHDLQENPDWQGQFFFVRLRDCSRQITKHPLDTLSEHLETKLDFREKIKASTDFPTVLFLDGMDELLMTQRLSEDEVISMLDALARLVEKYHQLYIIVTSRFNYVETSRLHRNNYLLLSLDYMNYEEQQQLVTQFRKVRGKNAVAFTNKTLKKVNESDEYKHVQELTQLPILLQMILISKIDIEQTGSRGALYNKLFSTVLNRKWGGTVKKDQQLQQFITDKFKPVHLRAYMAFLAFKIYQNQRGYLNRTEITSFEETKRFVRTFLKRERRSDDLKEVLKDILTSFYISEKVKDSDDHHETDREHDYAIEFLHKSLYEYLCCEHIWKSFKAFFLKKDDYGDYEYRTEEQILGKMQELLAQIRLNEEDQTLYYMKEIIAADKEDHAALSEQMAKALPVLCKYGFLLEVPKMSRSSYKPEQMVMNVFHAFMLIGGELNKHVVNEDDYFKIDWTDFVEREKVYERKEVFIKAYQSFNEETIAATEGSIVFLLNKEEHIQELEERYASFKEQLENDQALNVAQQLWLRQLLYRQKGKEASPLWLNALKKEEEYVIRMFRLLVGERMSLHLRLAFMDWAKVNLGVWFAVRVDLRGADLSGADLSRANLSRANLSRAYLSGADLSRADLSGADLSGAYLSGAYLSGADLSGADLSRADLSEADLSEADLRGADLRGANLRGANLRGAYLSGAYLSGADLSEADLRGANLRGAYLSGAYLSGADLSHTIVSNKDWFSFLKTQKVEGIEGVEQQYEIEQEEQIHETFFGIEVKGYKIIPRK